MGRVGGSERRDGAGSVPSSPAPAWSGLEAVVTGHSCLRVTGAKRLAERDIDGLGVACRNIKVPVCPCPSRLGFHRTDSDWAMCCWLLVKGGLPRSPATSPAKPVPLVTRCRDARTTPYGA